MNESMNFGNLGFSTVTEEKIDNTPAFASAEQNEPKEEQKVEETTEEKVDVEEMKKKDAEAANDFEQKSTAAQNLKNYEEDAANFQNIDFGPMQKYLDDDDITDISYSNGGQLWLKSLSKGVYRADQQEVDDALMEKIAFQCSNIMGKTFNMAHPFLDSESAELRMNFVHNSIARNGIAVVFRKTPAKIRLEKQKLLNEKYIQLNIHDFLINCVHAHCNIIVCGETGSGKTELVKYLASHTRENEKLISIEDTLELHLDRIYPTRDIVAMKTNNIASYSDVLVTCMRQNPIWILLSEVRSAEAVTAVRNSISSGHYILSTIHADKAESIPHRMYSLLESNIDVEQFLKTIYRYVQIGVFVRGRYKPEVGRFVREIAGVCEFHVTDDERAEFTNIYLKNVQGEETFTQPSKYFLRFMEGAGIDLRNLFGENKANVTDGMDMSQIKSPSVKINDDGTVVDTKTTTENNDNKPVEDNKTTEETKVEEPKVEEAPAQAEQAAAPELTVNLETGKTEEAKVEEPKVEEAPVQEEQTTAPELTVNLETAKAEETKVEEPKVEEAPVQAEQATAPELTVNLETAKAEETKTEELKVEEAPVQAEQTVAPELTVNLETAKVEEVKVEEPKVEEAPVQAEQAATPELTVNLETTKAEETKPEGQSLLDIAGMNQDNQNKEPENTMSETVQEAIPEQPTERQSTGSSPDDIVAKPMIDIATLQGEAQPTAIESQATPVADPTVAQTTVAITAEQVAMQPVAVPAQVPVQPVNVAPQVAVAPAPVAMVPQEQQVAVTPAMAPVQPMVQSQPVQPVVVADPNAVAQPVQQVAMVDPNTVAQPVQQVAVVDPNAVAQPVQQVVQPMQQPNAMMNNMQMGMVDQGVMNSNPMGVPLQSNNQNLSVNMESPLGFMNNNMVPNMQPQSMSPMGNQFFM